MSDIPDHLIDAANIGQFAADMRDERIARLQRENQQLRDFICKIFGRPFVEMADETKEVWR